MNSQNGNAKKAKQLGMPLGTAANRLRKMLLFDMMQRLGEDSCFRCGRRIQDIKNFSIEHKQPYLNSNNPAELFFDLNNIAFSHLSCNCSAGRLGEYPLRHGTTRGYRRGCRCVLCRKAKAKYKKNFYEKSK